MFWGGREGCATGEQLRVKGSPVDLTAEGRAGDPCSEHP